ncbi:MAG: hypothetical protein HPY52_15060 [Firmicutes bacterium]|nr:hypothetical protein [Bacillota bacterium]
MNYIFHERRIDVNTIARLIQKNEVAARSVVEGLVERGFLERQGERGVRTYHLSAAIYRRLGQKAAYVRIRGFEPEQQRQMIIQYAGRHGRITRGEAAELCKISEFQASRLLRALVADGYLELRGKGRGAYYEPKDHSSHGRP